MVLLLSMGGAFSLYAQSVKLNGEVYDEYNEPLPGVTVMVQGTTDGTITNLDGSFEFNASIGDKLKLSFIGYEDQIFEVLNSNHIRIQLLPSAELLDDLVVIGYGTVKKDDATGSVVAISSKDFNQGAISSPQDLLVGKTSGVQITSDGGAPGAGSTIRIRGGSSMSASNDPLIIVDGVPLDTDGVAGMSNPLSTVNPSDIETFTVLKDASATAIYGSRASNGVIIITTKQGKGGSKLKVDYSGNVSVSTASNQLDVMSADEYRAFVTDLYGEGSAAVNSLGDANTNWQDEIYRTAISTDHNVSMTGGLENLPYRLSLGYTNQSGILETSNMERYTIGLNLNPSFFDNHLKLAVNTKYLYLDNQFANTGAIGAAVAYDPTQSVYDDASPYGGYTTWVDNEGNPITIAPTNPVAMLNQYNNTSQVHRYILSAKLDYKLHFLPSITASVNVAVDGSKSVGETVVDPLASWSSPNDASRAGSYDPYDENKTNSTLDLYLTYNEQFGKHSVKAIGGYAYQHFYKEGSSTGYNYDRNNIITDQNNYANQNYLVSFFGRAEYGYDNRYLLTATVRQDGTSRFSSDNRWGTFPAFGFAWRAINEDFMADQELMSDLKVRLGWGITGQQNVVGNDLPYQGNYTGSNGQAYYPWNNGYIPTYRPEEYDENIKWEQTTTYNAGVDFGFIDNRITGSVDAYYRETTDLINTVPTAAGSNLSNTITTNVGNLTNKGVEVSLNYKPIVTQDFFWDIGANVTYNENEITKLTNVDDPTYLGVETGGISGGTGSTAQIHSVGHATNSFFVYEQVYDEAGNAMEGVYVDRNGDGVINSYDKYHYGQAAPKVMLGLNTRIEYKNWDFAMSGRFQFGASVYNNNASANGIQQDVYNSAGYLSNRLSGSQDGFTTSQYWSDHYVQNANFFRLDNISVGYNFTNQRLKARGISNLKVYATGQNLFVVSPYDGLDPEVSGGIDNNAYPRPTTFMLGVNLGF